MNTLGAVQKNSTAEKKLMPSSGGRDAKDHCSEYCYYSDDCREFHKFLFPRPAIGFIRGKKLLLNAIDLFDHLS